MTVNFGAITRTNGLVNFVLPTSGNFTTTNLSLGPWATVNGSDYADVVGGNIVAFAGYVNKDNAGHLGERRRGQRQKPCRPTRPYTGTLAGDVALGGIKYTAAANSTVEPRRPHAEHRRRDHRCADGGERHPDDQQRQPDRRRRRRHAGGSAEQHRKPAASPSPRPSSTMAARPVSPRRASASSR